MIDLKRCTNCKEIKPLTQFSRHRLSKDGHAWQCKQCNSERAKLFRVSPRGIYTRIRGRALFEKKKPFNLDKECFVAWYNLQAKHCVYCGISEEDVILWQDNFNRHVRKLSVDCMINDVGYVIENLVLACERCNTIKGNMFSHEQMLEIGDKYVRPIWERLKEETTI